MQRRPWAVLARACGLSPAALCVAPTGLGSNLAFSQRLRAGLISAAPDGAGLWMLPAVRLPLLGLAFRAGPACIAGPVYRAVRLSSRGWLFGAAGLSSRSWLIGAARLASRSWLIGAARLSSRSWLIGAARLASRGLAFRSGPAFIAGLAFRSLPNSWVPPDLLGCETRPDIRRAISAAYNRLHIA